MWILIAVVLAVVSGILLLYDTVINGVVGDGLMTWEHMANPVHIAIAVCLAGAMLAFLIDKVRSGGHPLKEAMEKYGPKKGIYVCKELMPWKEDIFILCKKLGIKGVKLEVADEGVVLAYSKAVRFEWPTVVFAHSWLLELERVFSAEAYDIILLILGHELAHIKTGDSYNRYNRKIMGIFLLLVFVLMAPIVLVNVLMDRTVFSGALTMILVLIWMICALFVILIVSPVSEDIRYWGQVNELRADRTGMLISGVPIDTFRKMALFLQAREKLQNSDRKEKVLNSQNIRIRQKLLEKAKKKLKDKFHDKAEDDPHPSWQVRVREFEVHQGEPWSMTDELRYMWRFAWNTRIHGEWRL